MKKKESHRKEKRGGVGGGGEVHIEEKRGRSRQDRRRYFSVKKGVVMQ